MSNKYDVKEHHTQKEQYKARQALHSKNKHNARTLKLREREYWQNFYTNEDLYATDCEYIGEVVSYD